MGHALGGLRAVDMASNVGRTSGGFQCAPAGRTAALAIRYRRRDERARDGVLVALARRRDDMAAMLRFVQPILDFLMTTPPPKLGPDLLRQAMITTAGMANMLMRVALEQDPAARAALEREAGTAAALLAELARSLRAEREGNK